MTKVELKSKEPFVILPLKEYNYMKSVIKQIGDKIGTENDSDYLTPLQVKRLEEIDEKISNGDWSDFIGYEEFKGKLLDHKKTYVQTANRKKSSKIYS